MPSGFANVGTKRKRAVTTLAAGAGVVQFGVIKDQATPGIQITQTGQLWQVTLVNSSSADATYSIYGIDEDQNVVTLSSGAYLALTALATPKGGDVQQVVWYGPALQVAITATGGNFGVGNPITIECKCISTANNTASNEYGYVAA